MGWLQFIAGIGIGTVCAKLLDIFWLQRRQEQAAAQAWLRDKRLEAFSEVVKEFLSFGLHDGDRKSAFQSFASISKAVLLIDNEDLTRRMDHFLVDMARLNKLTDAEDTRSEEGERLYVSLTKEGREIASELRKIILEGAHAP